MPHALIVDDDEEMCAMLAHGLSRRGFEVTTRRSAADALAWLEHADAEVVVTDLAMKGMNGLDLCRRVVEGRPDVPVVVITAFGSLDTAVAAIRAGAYDFVTKPFELDALALALERAVRHRALTQEVVRLRKNAAAPDRFEAMIGASDVMKALFDHVARVAETDVAVLVTGDSGTGKELVARAIHARSRRAARPFHAVDCTLPEQLLARELLSPFSGGTVFLDEVAAIPPALQAELAHLAIDARLVSSTRRDLESLVEQGRFREDLFHRLSVVPLPVPPLRARGRDVLLLAQAFLERHAAHAGKPVTGLTAPAAEKLLAYSWPGNVRELGKCIERAVALTRFAEITVDDLPETVRDFHASHVVLAASSPSDLVPLDEVERRYILHVVEAVGGSRTIASRVLGLDRKTLYRRLKAYGVNED